MFRMLTECLVMRPSPAYSTALYRVCGTTRVSRALLLMAAQGKTRIEETLDVPSAYNGFSGMRPCSLGAMKVIYVDDARRSTNTAKGGIVDPSELKLGRQV